MVGIFLIMKFRLLREQKSLFFGDLFMVGCSCPIGEHISLCTWAALIAFRGVTKKEDIPVGKEMGLGH